MNKTLLLLPLLAFAASAQAGRPLATEDADVLEPGQCEWESFAARTRADGEAGVRGWTTQFGCGLGARTQAALAYSRARSDGATAEGLLLGGKTQLLARQDDATGWTLAWGLAAAKPPGGSFEHDTTYLNLVATRALGEGLTGHANLGWLRSQSAHASSTTWNLAAEQAVGAGVDLMGELYGDDRSETWLGLGARWTPSEHLSLNASWARQGGAASARLWTLGVKFSF